MKTILEIYYLRLVLNRVRYQRKEVNVSRKGSDPDRVIWSLIRQNQHGASEEAEEHQFVIHSTSWRYERPRKVVLTYIAYSDELTFEKGNWKSLSLKQLGQVNKKSRKPPSRAALEKKVVSHAMRHIAFLIKTDDGIDFKTAMRPETMEAFENLWVSLAGRIF